MFINRLFFIFQNANSWTNDVFAKEMCVFGMMFWGQSIWSGILFVDHILFVVCVWSEWSEIVRGNSKLFCFMRTVVARKPTLFLNDFLLWKPSLTQYIIAFLNLSTTFTIQARTYNLKSVAVLDVSSVITGYSCYFNSFQLSNSPSFIPV